MARPSGVSKLKDNSKKNYRAAEEWKAKKKEGRPKQRWVKSTINGQPFPEVATMEQIEQLINEDTVGSYVDAHWEKVK